ncbi:uncharacterized protein LOC121862517 [Homarus americanus]|nr:uncharacterized protein LOC121862517 [Homarus americanus]
MSPVLGGVVDGRVSADGDGGRVSASGGEMAADVYSSVFVSCEAPTPLRPPYIVTIVCRHCPVKIIVSFEPKEELWSRNTPGDSHRSERGLFTILEVDREDEQKGSIIPHQYGKLELPHPGDHRYEMRTEDNWVGRVSYVEAGCGGSGYLLTNLTEDGAGGSFSCTTADDSEQSRKKTTKVKKRPTNPQTPTLTYTSWPDLKTHLEVQFPHNVSLPEDVRGVHLPVRRCLPELHPCPSPRHHYLPDKRHLRKVFMRLKPRGQLNIDLDLKFKEDVACRCKERSPSLSSSSAASSLLMPPLPPLSNSLNFIDVQLRTVPNKVTRCKPVTMYVPWEDVRNYINTVVRDLMIPPHHRARPLPVKRCHQTLAPCEKPDYYCGLVLDGRASKKLYLYGRNVTLQVGFYEDKKCECMSEDRYNILRDHSLPGVPVITYVKVIRDNLV